MEIVKILIITGRGTDKLSLQTNLPEGTWPFEGKQYFSTNVAQGAGEEYCKKHFPDVEVKIVRVL